MSRPQHKRQSPRREASVEGVPIRSLPKVSLHDHLDGGLRASTVFELASAEGTTLPAANSRELGEWFAEQANAGSLVDYLKTFALTISVMQSAENLTRVAREYVEDLANDGVIYGEVRWAPEQHLEGGLSLEDAVQAVQDGIEEGEDAAEANGHSIRRCGRGAGLSRSRASLSTSATTASWASISRDRKTASRPPAIRRRSISWRRSSSR
jgi:adenosine deaminase